MTEAIAVCLVSARPGYFVLSNVNMHACCNRLKLNLPAARGLTGHGKKGRFNILDCRLQSSLGGYFNREVMVWLFEDTLMRGILP